MPPPPDPRDDQQLVTALNAGDAAAFDALYFRYRDRVARLAYRFTGSHDDAMDVLQDTVVYVAGKFPGFTLTARFTTFLYPVVRNLSLAVRRRRARAIGVDGDDLELAADPRASQPGDDDDVAALVASLPNPHRQVVLPRFVDDLSLDEIAEALGVPLGTVKSRLHNALRMLRDDPRVRDSRSA